MPQKAYERGFCHVMVFACFFQMPHNRCISFSVPFFQKPVFSWKRPAFNGSKSLKYPILESDGENKAFQGFRKYEVGGISRKRHVINFKTDKEPKMNRFDFGVFQRKFHHMTKSIFTCFSGHFMVPSVRRRPPKNYESCENPNTRENLSCDLMIPIQQKKKKILKRSF